MASAEESSSSGGPPSVDSYIGSVISLTSKSEIRYEGVLVSINPRESTIALQNVKSFGTEGRRKEGPQIPTSDRVYEYILFRGSDIKDLQVKSPSSISTKQQTHNDPAIIQSHYATNVPAASAGIGAPTGISSNTVNQDLPRQPFPDTYSLYQTGGHLNSWAPSPALANQGYGSTSNVQAHTQQQPVPFQPWTSLQNPLQYSEVYAPTSMPNFPETATASTFPHQYAISNPPNSLSVLSGNTLPSSLPSPLPALSSLASSNQELNTTNMISNNAGTSHTSFLPVSSMPFTTSSVLRSTSGPTTVPPLLTPDQLTMSIPPATSSIQKLHPESKDMGALFPRNSSSTISGMPQEPLLPLPVPSQQGEHGTRQFSEEFDFTAMNEKFNKVEVWGSLGKEKQIGATGDGTEDGTVHYNTGFSEGYVQEAPKPGSKPVYNKDDFFDTLSCNSLNRGGWNGRTRLSERMKLDTETFGEFQQRPPMGNGPHANYGAPHPGYYRGSYNRGRGYGYYGGRGHGGYNRPF